MKTSPCARLLVGLLVPGLGVMGCGEQAVPSSPETAATPSFDPGILTLVGTALSTSAEAPLAGVSVHRNHAYVGGMSSGYFTTANIGVRIVDLSDPTNPTLVGRIPLRQRGQSQDHSHGDAVVTSLATAAFEGDVAIVRFGVPDDNTNLEPYGIWDVTNPSNPTFLSALDLGGASLGHHEGGDLGDKPYDAKAVAGNYFYAIYLTHPSTTRDARLAVVDISDPGNPVVVGDWQDNSEVWLIGLSLNESATRAYITGLWPPPYAEATHGYLYIVDIQNPSQPTEIGRYVFPVRGLPSSVSIARPTSDDALAVLADHSWEGGNCGILYILDTSNPAAISKISSFALPQSSANFCGNGATLVIATDVAIRGNLVYSTWLRGGVRAIDISDPANPVAVGSFSDGGNFSDIALLGNDYVVATEVWDAGMVILKANSQ